MRRLHLTLNFAYIAWPKPVDLAGGRVTQTRVKVSPFDCMHWSLEIRAMENVDSDRYFATLKYKSAQSQMCLCETKDAFDENHFQKGREIQVVREATREIQINLVVHFLLSFVALAVFATTLVFLEISRGNLWISWLTAETFPTKRQAC